MVDSLVLRGFLQVLRLDLSCPHHVPLRAVWAHNPDPSCFERVDHRVVDVRGVRDFKTHSHVVLKEVVLTSFLHLLELL